MRMFKSRLRTGGVLINVLIAVAVSLIVNFSYFVFMILHRTARMPSEHPVSENSTLFMVLEVLFYMAVSFILLTVFTHKARYARAVFPSGCWPLSSSRSSSIFWLPI